MLTISRAISNLNLKTALIPFITAGYPNLDATLEVIRLLDQHGVHAIELGVPYSDALADGFVIQESSRIALMQKTYIDQVLQLVNTLDSTIKAPIIIFTYLNPVLSKGAEVFIQEIARAGVKGLVMPDLPLEEADYFISLCSYYDIELILFVSPSSSPERINEIVLKAPGCIYLVSSYGVTGKRGDGIDTSVIGSIKRIKSLCSKPIMLGFGISNEHQVASIMSSGLSIDAVVMGTAFIEQIKVSYMNNNYDNLDLFCTKLKNAIS
jgi:tryptophan synthase alpha chain